MVYLLRLIVINFVVLASLFLPAHGIANDMPKLSAEQLAVLDEVGTHKVIKIIDPLTIQLENNELVSLVGLDIPDFNPHAPGPMAQSVTAILTDLLLDKEVTFYQTQNRSAGRKNRMRHSLYHVLRKNDGVWAQGVLIRVGLARVRSVRDNPELIDTLYTLEHLARSEQLGLWGLEKHAILSSDSAMLGHDHYSIVQGTVLDTARKQSTVYLNFGKDWRKDFTVKIKSSHLNLFRKKNLDPMDLKGKTIEVRGWIKDYNGPYIEIDHPERIQIMDE